MGPDLLLKVLGTTSLANIFRAEQIVGIRLWYRLLSIWWTLASKDLEGVRVLVDAGVRTRQQSYWRPTSNLTSHSAALLSNFSSDLPLLSLLANWNHSYDSAWRWTVVENVYKFTGKGPIWQVECCLFVKVKSLASKYRPVSLSILMNTLTLKNESLSVCLCITLKGSSNQCGWVDKSEVRVFKADSKSTREHKASPKTV